jgi:hypothetical protein
MAHTFIQIITAVQMMAIAFPDQDRISVSLLEDWNSLLIKVLQGGGGWGFYVRLVDPEDRLSFSTRPMG